MIGEYSLELLCNKYNLSKEELVNNNNNILTKGEYEAIDKTLNYLINELNINSRNIEKCPSILYRNVDAIKSNVSFLKVKNVSFSSIETCLHVLSSEPNDLKETYEYIEENYGTAAIERNTSALKCKVETIKEVEDLKLNKGWNLTIAVSIEFKRTTIENVKNIIHSAEFKEHPELFTSEVLAHSKIDDIKEIIDSAEFKEHPELFTSTVLAHSKIDDIKEIIDSAEFKEHPELFTSQVLAQSKIDDIKEIIHSAEFKEHSELFTSTVLAHSKIDDIKEIIDSAEFKEHPELFTSTVLARSKIDDIKKLLKMECWNNERYKNLLKPTIVANSKIMIKKLPILFEMAEEFGISDYLNTRFLRKSPSQDYALINFLIDNNLPLVTNNKLNSIFSYLPCELKEKYDIDINELMKKYPYEPDETYRKGKNNGVR